MVIFDVIPVVFVEASFDEKKMHFSSFVKKLHFFFKVENLKRFIELGAINKTQNSNNKLGFFVHQRKSNGYIHILICNMKVTTTLVEISCRMYLNFSKILQNHYYFLMKTYCA